MSYYGLIVFIAQLPMLCSIPHCRAGSARPPAFGSSCCCADHFSGRLGRLFSSLSWTHSELLLLPEVRAKSSSGARALLSGSSRLPHPPPAYRLLQD